MENDFVVLSTTLIIGEGTFRARRISQDAALAWTKAHHPVNYCGHQTVKLLGVDPATARWNCTGYREALCVSAKSRLESGREYTLGEIEKIGVNYTLIERVSNEA